MWTTLSAASEKITDEPVRTLTDVTVWEVTRVTGTVGPVFALSAEGVLQIPVSTGVGVAVEPTILVLTLLEKKEYVEYVGAITSASNGRRRKFCCLGRKKILVRRKREGWEGERRDRNEV